MKMSVGKPVKFHLFMHSLLASHMCLTRIKPTALAYQDNTLTS